MGGGLLARLQPDAGRVEWSSRVTVGYLEQQASLNKGQTIRDVLRDAFQGMYELEAEMLALYDRMASAASADLEAMMEEAFR